MMTRAFAFRSKHLVTTSKREAISKAYLFLCCQDFAENYVASRNTSAGVIEFSTSGKMTFRHLLRNFSFNKNLVTVIYDKIACT